MKVQRNMTWMIILCFIIGQFLFIQSTVVVLNGGQITVNGAITATQADFTITYTANVKWLAMILSPDQVNADVHLFIVDSTNTANPIQVRDAHLDQVSSIVYDDVNNIQPSITGFTSDISFGLKAAYNRDLATGDSKDLRFYPNEVIQICFISSLEEFKGNGYQIGHNKICSYFSMHQQLIYNYDRLLGNYASSALIGGSNFTLYATQSYDGYDILPWLFVSFVHKQQGLSPYNGKWVGITYEDSLAMVDLTLVEYSTLNFTLDIHIRDMYAANSSFAQEDINYVQNQGGPDIIKVAGGIDQAAYMVASYKRKFSTGDVNRDKIIEDGLNSFCIMLGNSLVYSTFVRSERTCLQFILTSSYNKQFRVLEESSTIGSSSSPLPNTVKVKKAYSMHQLCSIIMLVIIIFGFII